MDFGKFRYDQRKRLGLPLPLSVATAEMTKQETGGELPAGFTRLVLALSVLRFRT